MSRSPVILVFCWLAGCGKEAAKPDAAKVVATPPAASAASSAPASAPAPAPVAAPEADDGLKAVVAELVEVAKGYDSAKAAALGTKLRPRKDWWQGAFGDELGQKLYHDYVNVEEIGAESILTFFREAAGSGRTEVHVVKIQRADDPSGNAFQAAALKAMKQPFALYTVSMSRPGEKWGKTLWSFAAADGGFVYLGRMHPLRSGLMDTLFDELPLAEAQAFPLLDFTSGLAGKPAEWAAAKDAAGVKGALLAEAKGKPVAVVWKEDGQVLARTLDGAVSRVLATGFRDAQFAPRLDLIWLGKEGEIAVLDLREDDPKPRRIMKLPRWADSQISISWSPGGVEETINMGSGYGIGVLRWDREAKFEVADPEADPKQYKVVGKDWLVSQLERKVNDPPTAAFSPPAFGASGLVLVPWIIPDVDGKQGFRMDYDKLRLCQLEDPKSKKVGRAAGRFGGAVRALTMLRATCGGSYRFDPTGRALLAGQSACDAAGCVALEGYALDWLIGGVDGKLALEP